MRYTTFDIEYADVILPSICSITILDWEDGEIVDTFSTLVNPECDIQEFLFNKHGLSLEQLDKYPTLNELWIQIYDRLNNKIVFSHNANRNFTALKQNAEILYLNMPNLIFCCTYSICKRLWPYFEEYSLKYVTERLGINENHFNSYEDAKSVGLIVEQALSDTHTDNMSDLFNAIGFAGGVVFDENKKVYRAIKKENGYLARFKKDQTAIDWNAAYSNETENIVSNSIFSI